MRPGAAFLGGGTNLVDLMKLGVVAPDMLVDVTGLLPDRIERTVKRDGEVGGGATDRRGGAQQRPGR